MIIIVAAMFAGASIHLQTLCKFPYESYNLNHVYPLLIQ